MAIKVPDDPKYLRVGTDYFKLIEKPDRFNIKRNEIKKWSIEAIRLDHGQKYLYSVPKFDDFIIVPNNNGAPKEISGCYNMYHDFPHTPKAGSWPWTLILLKQIFGTQFKTGMQYLKVLFENPDRILPILVLVSEQRQTGKSTFLDWLNMLFGANMVMIEPDVVGSSFNGEYATANIIGIDETILDKQIAVEKIKSLATKKFISVNIKNVQQFKVPFFGKIILASNNEDKFMKIDDAEIRFWIRKLGTPRITNHNILNDMVAEIPAFLHYLSDMPDMDFTRSRMVFTADQVKNQWLEDVKRESRSWMHKELIECFTDYFNDNSSKPYVYARPKDIKEMFFLHNNQVQKNYIRQVLKKEMGINTVFPGTYPAELCLRDTPINGTPFQIDMSNIKS